jgi:hypothetical protein
VARIRLSDEDRARIGLDQEWIEGFDLSTFMVSDAEALEDAGYQPDQFLEDLRGVPMVLDGQPVMVDDGEGGQRQRRRIPARALRASMWLCVRRAGLDVPYVGFDYQVNAVRYEQEPAGKDPATRPPSGKTANGTSPRSRRSSTSGRGKSAS